jgi:hypothetical protein
LCCGADRRPCNSTIEEMGKRSRGDLEHIMF